MYRNPRIMSLNNAMIRIENLSTHAMKVSVNLKCVLMSGFKCAAAAMAIYGARNMRIFHSHFILMAISLARTAEFGEYSSHISFVLDIYRVNTSCGSLHDCNGTFPLITPDVPVCQNCFPTNG
jgi:hypothetical protein